MRKFLRVFSILIMVLLLVNFTGCKKAGKSTKSEDALFSDKGVDLNGKTITIGVPNENNIPQEDDSRMINEYQKHVNAVRLAREKAAEQQYNCNIEWKVYNNQTILSDMAAGTSVADIVYLNSSSGALSMILQNLIIPLDQYIDFSTGLYANDVQKASLWNGKHYGLVSDWTRSGQTMSYNKDMIQKAGLTDPYELMQSGQWTWDTFLEMAKKITVHDESNPANGTWGMIDTDFNTTYVNFIYSNGGNFIKLNDSGKYELSLESNETKEALKFVTDLYTTSKVLYNTLGDRNNRQQGAFIFRAGKAAFMASNYSNYARGGGGAPGAPVRNANGNPNGNSNGNSSGNSNAIQNPNNFPEFETGTVPYPKGPNAAGYGSYSVAGSNIYAIPSTVKDPQSIATVLFAVLSIFDSTQSDYVNYESEAVSQSSAEQIAINKKLSENLDYTWFLSDTNYSTPLYNIFTGIITDNKTIDDSISTQKSTFDTLINTLNQKLSQ